MLRATRLAAEQHAVSYSFLGSGAVYCERSTPMSMLMLIPHISLTSNIIIMDVNDEDGFC